MASREPFDERTVALALIDTVRETIPGVKGYPYPEASMQMPCIVVTMGYDMNTGMGGKVSNIDCELLVLVQPGDGASGGRLLSELCSGTGARSIKLALEADETLGGVVSSLRYIGPRTKTYERYDGDGNLTYLGRYLRVTIYP